MRHLRKQQNLIFFLISTEEVLGSGGALWFSPDGSKIAIGRFDDTDVEKFTYILYEDQYEKEVALRYPKVSV